MEQPALDNSKPALLLPPLTPGKESSEFILAAVALVAVFISMWCGKLDSGLASTLIGLIVTSFPALRVWLKASHADAAAVALGHYYLAQNSGGRANAVLAIASALKSPAEAPGATPFTAGGTSTIPMVAAAVAMAMIAMLISGCAEESYRLGTKTAAARGRIQCNATGITVEARPNYYYFHADKLDNSTATTAGGRAFAGGVNAVGSAAGGMVLSAGSSGLFGKAAGAAVPLATSIFSKAGAHGDVGAKGERMNAKVLAAGTSLGRAWRIPFRTDAERMRLRDDVPLILTLDARREEVIVGPRGEFLIVPRVVALR